MLGRALPLRNTHTGAIEKWFGSCADIHEAVESRFAARRMVSATREAIRINADASPAPITVI